MQEGFIISAYHGEKRKETKNPVFAHCFDSKASISSKGITLK